MNEQDFSTAWRDETSDGETSTELANSFIVRKKVIYSHVEDFGIVQSIMP